jgi:hypothetical protein
MNIKIYEGLRDTKIWDFEEFIPENVSPVMAMDIPSLRWIFPHRSLRVETGVFGFLEAVIRAVVISQLS